jgi:hypothetical protein
MSKYVLLVPFFFILAGCGPVTVRGFVYDNNLEAIEGAKIVNMRTDSVLYSGKDGSFTLTGIHLSDTILATAPGYLEDHYIFKYYGKYTFRGPIGLVLKKKK